MPAHDLSNLALLTPVQAEGPPRAFYDACHRVLDLTIAIPLSVLLSPLLFLVGILIRLDSPGPALFLQERLGRYGRRFIIWKFRTMTAGVPTAGHHLFLQKNDSRITRLGKLLRSLSLDEMPQLVNVVRGQMSLVGPRPPVPWFPHELENYPEEAKTRFLVRPGITGYSQAIARREATWDERCRHDAWYVRNRSLRLYVWILWRTVFRVLSREGVDHPTEG